MMDSGDTTSAGYTTFLDDEIRNTGSYCNITLTHRMHGMKEWNLDHYFYVTYPTLLFMYCIKYVCSSEIDN